ncbi:Uncharacterised protein family (UPF0175) [Caloranaerobacter azorensis DSM 13643]|uniref:Uncharacterized protein family (UPF0175) n=1 Tax=Caloranaerobacter azorensis DSM 13643 TaxID=1121264 RepID=A0A1M5V0J3_9FIRM|nr:UPF0175 family protein [Caloranaerobacter azorensis]SHH68775.1 Uncharacterised protein family (UPF0175) [Caloranaerobacter azorensis DSM 13643]
MKQNSERVTTVPDFIQKLSKEIEKYKKGNKEFESLIELFKQWEELADKKDKTTYEINKVLAVKCYKNKKLSLGQCAELAEMSESDFIKYLGKQKICIFNFDSEKELLEDIKNA